MSARTYRPHRTYGWSACPLGQANTTGTSRTCDIVGTPRAVHGPASGIAGLRPSVLGSLEVMTWAGLRFRVGQLLPVRRRCQSPLRRCYASPLCGGLVHVSLDNLPRTRCTEG